MLLTLVVLGGAGLTFVATAGLRLISCDREFSQLSKALPQDVAVVELEARFPNHEDANTGCDADDNTASAGIGFKTGLPKERAKRAGIEIFVSRGWSEYESASACYAKVIRGHSVYGQLLPPDQYDKPGIDLVVSLTTGGCI